MSSKTFRREQYNEISSSSNEDEVEQPQGVSSSERSHLIKAKSSKTTQLDQPITANDVGLHTETLKVTQYFAAIVATIGGFIMGTTLGWTAPASPMMINNQYGFTITKENISWIAAFMPIGALLSCPVMAILVDKLGRKNLMVMLTIPTIIGWEMILWAESVTLICIGRFLTGFVSGSYSVIIPLYISEIAEKEIRGTLGTFFQLQINVGILYTYVMGSIFQVFGLSFSCTIIPVVYICFLLLIPESPSFYLMKGYVDEARLSLRYFRGPFSNVDQELNTMQNSLAKAERERLPLTKAFQTKSAKRGLILGIGLMVFQQFSGANAVIFFATNIFLATGNEIQPNTSTIIIGVIAVIFTYISTLIIDRLGRKILLLCSIVTMGVCTFFIGEFFYLKDTYSDVSFIIGLIPLISLCIFIISFSMGFGPIPWIMIGEIFPSHLKGVACSIVCTSNWLFVILVTKYFTILVSEIGTFNTFWLFTMFSMLGIFFVLFRVPETKGKSIEEIQELLGADTVPVSSDNQNEIHAQV